jgi:MFS family permease
MGSVLLEASRARGTKGPRLVTPAFVLVCVSNFAYFLAVGALLPVVPLFVEGPLEGGSIAVGLTYGAFALAAVLLRPFSGRLGDSRGRRVLIVLGGGLVAVAVLGHVAVDSLGILLLLRLLGGAGEAFFYVGTASAINDLAPDERRGEALSYFSLSLFAGIGLGPVVGELILNATSFDITWLFGAAASGVAALMGFVIPETRPAGIGAQKMRLIHPAALTPGIVMAASIWGLATYMAFVPLYAREIGMSGSSALFALHSGLVFTVRLFGARLPDRLGYNRAATGALTCSVIGFALIALWASPVGLVIGTSVWSIGHSLAFPALMSMAVKSAPASERGAVIGTFTAFFDLAFGLGAVSAGAIVAAVDYPGGFLSSSVAAVAGLVLLRERRRAKRSEAQGIEGGPATLSVPHGGRSSAR